MHLCLHGDKKECGSTVRFVGGMRITHVWQVLRHLKQVSRTELLYAHGRDAKRRGREMSRQLEAHLKLELKEESIGLSILMRSKVSSTGADLSTDTINL